MPSEALPIDSPTLTINEENSLQFDAELGQPLKSPTDAQPPDGGLDAWPTVFGASLVAFATFGVDFASAVNGYGAFNDYYANAYLSNYSVTLISMIGAIQIFLLYLSSEPHSGKLAFAIGFPVGTASLGGIIYPVMLNKLPQRIGFAITAPRPRIEPLPPLAQLLAFRAFRDPAYTCLCLAGWFTVLATWNPFFYVGLYGAAASGGASTALTPYYLAIMSATAILARIGSEFVADRVGRFNVICGSTTLSAILILALWHTSAAQPNLIACSALYGFSSGPFFALISISPLGEVGARVGMLFAFMSTAALAGTPIGGIFIRAATLPNFRHLILFSGIMALVGSGFAFAARFIRSRTLVKAIRAPITRGTGVLVPRVSLRLSMNGLKFPRVQIHCRCRKWTEYRERKWQLRGKISDQNSRPKTQDRREISRKVGNLCIILCIKMHESNFAAVAWFICWEVPASSMITAP
ncbi:hypothetical protein DFH07DRAFT_782167 [Mycena maculata]|uniref:MFS general substrate transporter n=1 Tax=Mycena maculata TaxID=230809 RepID=A0AAD7HUN6_9AGAR|nr:hypothetical protein DFH07DRAFT_782167 [Mycena maculata]